MTDQESLGKYLQREREARRISLREVADHTRVREHFLKAIEEDQFDLLPSGTYVKGFLLTYAKYIGLDPNDVILRYERILRGEPARDVEVPPERKGSWNRKHLLMIGGAVGAGFVALYFFLYLSKSPVESIPVSPKSEESLPPLPSPQTAAISSVPEKEPLSLQLKAVEKTWVSVEVDDQPGKEMLLRPGEGASYQGQKRIFLIIGNAGGLDLIFNGRLLERFGTSGEVVTLTVVPEGVEAKRHEKPKTP